MLRKRSILFERCPSTVVSEHLEISDESLSASKSKDEAASRLPTQYLAGMHWAESNADHCRGDICYALADTNMIGSFLTHLPIGD